MKEETYKDDTTPSKGHEVEMTTKAKPVDATELNTKPPITVKDPERGSMFKIIRSSIKSPPTLKGGYRLMTERRALDWSMIALRFGVVADSVSSTILQPNFAFLARVGSTPDSFDSTAPFGFSGATYFLPMTAMLGAAITSSFVGTLSDRIGRRPCMLTCVGVSVFGTLIKYFARKTFWGFCAANFANGLFGATVPVAMAYASDVHSNRQKKDAEIGILVGCYMIAMSGGGIVAILMESHGLFSPLWVGAGLNALAFFFMYFVLLEPDKTIRYDEKVDKDDEEAPETLHISVTTNVVIGALLDNIGSTGLNPLTLSPLALDTFNTDFLDRGESPIMSDVAYKWISVAVALMVLPGAALTDPIFAKIGPAGGCVFGNLITAVGIVACCIICEIDPPTTGTLVGYVSFMYSIYPLTVVSQLSTGPMLDRLAPKDRRGLVQGINVTVMNLSNAVAPWALGTLADSIGIVTTLWIAVGISVAAAVVNLPLSFTKELRMKKKVNYQKALELEDHELVERALRGEYVPAQFLFDLNEARMNKGEGFLIPPCSEYKEDKDRLDELKENAVADFAFFRARTSQFLADLDQPEMIESLVEKFNHAIPSEQVQEKNSTDMGRWFGEYMKDNGYFLDGGDPIVLKEMIMRAFPSVNADGEMTEENAKKMMLAYIATFNNFLHDEEPSPATSAFRQAMVL